MSMDRLHEWLGGPLDALLVVAVEVAILGALALTLERLLARRIRPSLRAALVAAVLLRAAVPLHVEIEGAPIARPSLAAAEPATAPEAPAANPSSIALSSEVVMLSRGSGELRRPQGARPRGRRPEPGARAMARERESAGSPRPDAPFPWRAWTGLGWLAVAGVLLVRLVRGELRLRRLMGAAPAADGRVKALVEELGAAMDLRRVPTCVRVESIPSAAVHGALRPRLLIHPDTADLPDGALRAVLTHELLHVKRRDLVWAPLLAFLQVLWWPHPLVHLLSRRLRDVVEEARDGETCALLSRSETPKARLAYARLLLDLADAGRRMSLDPTASPVPSLEAGTPEAAGLIPFVHRGRALTRRITMIFDPPRTHPVATACGTCALAAVVWFGFFAAKAPAAGAATSDQEHIVVERQGPLPDWHQEISARLDETMSSVAIDAANVREAMLEFAELTGLGAVLHPETQTSWPVRLKAENVTAREVLDLIVWHLDGCDWSVADGSLHVGPGLDLARRLELRLYKIEPLLDSLNEGLHAEYEISRADLLNTLMDLLQDQRFNPYDLEGVTMDFWQGSLAYRSTDRHHGKIQSLLDRLIRRESAPDRAGEAWRAPLAAALDATCSKVPGNFANDLELLRWLCKEGHPQATPVLLADTDEVYAELEGSDAATSLGPTSTVREVLEAMFEQQGLFVELSSGAVVVSRHPRTPPHFYEFAPFLDAVEDVNDMTDELVQFLSFDVASHLWDEVPTCYAGRLGNLFIVSQLEREQPHVKALIDQFRRALSDR